MWRAASVAVIAACSAAAPPAKPIESHVVDVQPRGTASPVIAWKDSAFATDTLPAVARGGEITVVPHRDGDGGRGYPNLRVEVRDRTDKVIQTIQVMTSNEFETLAPEGVIGSALQHRIEAANAELAKLHGVHDLVPMHALEVQKPADGEPHFAIGDGLDIDWNKDHVHVFHHNTDRSFITLDGTPWLAKSYKPCANCDVCENPAYLAAVYHATSINVLVVEIGYKGTDLCWDPGDQLHAIAW